MSEPSLMHQRKSPIYLADRHMQQKTFHYEIMVEGRVSMRERKGLRAASLKDNKTDA